MIIFFQVITSAMTQAISVPKSVVDENCIILETPIASTCIAIGMMVSQSVLLCITYRGKISMSPAARRSRIVTVVMRDGILAFGVVIGGSSSSLIRYRYINTDDLCSYQA